MTRWFPRLLAVAVLTQFTVYAIRPVISYQALSLGAGATELGLITASFSVLSLLLAVPIGRSVDRWGETVFVVTGTLLLTGVALALLVPTNLVTLGLGSAALGLGHLVTIVAEQTLIAKGSQAARRDSRFANFTVVNTVGQLSGPAAAGLLIGNVSGISAGAPGEVANAHRVYLVCAVAALLATLAGVSLRLFPGALALRPDLSGGTPARATLARVLAVPSMPLAMVTSLTVLSATDLLAAYLPAYGVAHDIPVRTVGLLLAVSGLASLVGRLGMLRLIARFTRRRLLAGTMLIAAVGLAAIPLVGSVPLLFVAMLLVGWGLGLGQPITLAWVAGQAPREIRGTAVSVRLSGNRLGQAVVPAAVGGLAGATGLAAAFLSPALLLVIGGTFVLRARFTTDP